ncbi:MULTISPECIES: hypothetical protein [unclassified Ruegeria]|uniref:hypothetical protein n=1 Tax=unclassified Ruegeria TaxID=2625375 RepID=UPI00147F1FBB|nr:MULTISPECIES: hypothetical protein [unclassified Ruegeria]NOE34461.1 hypothetical protein [Ruegeria sp. HKCCD7318]
MKIAYGILAALAVVFFILGGSDAHAKDNKGKKPNKGGKNGDVSIQIEDKPGIGPKAVPPGQIKRYTRGAKLPSDLEFEDIGDLSKWKLGEPGKGNRYILVDDEVLEVTNDLSTVVDAVGIVGDLLN